MKIKRLIIPIAAITVSLVSAFSAFADYTISYELNGATVTKNAQYFVYQMLPENTGVVSTATVTDSYDGTVSKYEYLNYSSFNYPGWQIRNGYFYYLTDVNTALKNTTTPDGYRVDDKGRWIDGTGNPVSDGFGGNFLNTKEKYAGKYDAEIWSLQKSFFKELSKNQKYHAGFGYIDEVLSTGRDNFEIGDLVFYRNQEDYNNHRTNYCDLILASYMDLDATTEKILRAYLGDELGIEMFNYLVTTRIPFFADGMYELDFKNKFDLNKFNGHMTDYGKHVTTTYSEVMNRLTITVY